MEQENRDLLLRYLTMALPYGLICSIYRIDDWNAGWRDEKLTGYFNNGTAYEFYFGKSPISIDNDIFKIKPYLRPMSSMTDEEKKEYYKFCIAKFIKAGPGYTYDGWWEYYDTTASIDWATKKMFDYRGLINKGLALEAPKEMYNS